MKIKIISDGTKYSTRVINADTGEEIENVTDIKIKLSAKDGFARATLSFVDVQCEMTAELKEGQAKS